MSFFLFCVSGSVGAALGYKAALFWTASPGWVGALAGYSLAQGLTVIAVLHRRPGLWNS